MLQAALAEKASTELCQASKSWRLLYHLGLLYYIGLPIEFRMSFPVLNRGSKRLITPYLRRISFLHAYLVYDSPAVALLDNQKSKEYFTYLIQDGSHTPYVPTPGLGHSNEHGAYEGRIGTSCLYKDAKTIFFFTLES